MRKFTEAVDNISNERTIEIIESIKDSINILNDTYIIYKELSEELSKYKSDSKEKNDQIDNSIINIDTSKSKIDEIMSIMDNVNVDLQNYIDEGRNYIY